MLNLQAKVLTTRQSSNKLGFVLTVCSFEKRTKRVLFISSVSRRKRTKEDCYPQGPLHRGMQFQNWENHNFDFVEIAHAQQTESESVVCIR